MTWHATGKCTELGKMQHLVDGRLCMKESSFMLTLLIPGPKSLGKHIDVYMRPLIDDLKDLWALKGYKACPTCNEDTPSIRVFGHKRFLKKPHKWRRSLDFNGETEGGDPPRKFNRDQIMAQLARLSTRLKGKHPSEFPNQDMKEEFLGWFGSQIRQRNIDKDSGASASTELYALACGPTPTPILVNSCVVNGVRPVVHNHDERRATQKNGIFSPGDKDGDMYYGQLEEILDFLYMSFKFVLFQVNCDDRPLPHQIGDGHRGKGIRKPNLGGRKASMLNTRKETRYLGLRKITDQFGPQAIRFEWNDRGKLMPHGDYAPHWSNLLGEIVREFSMHYPSWHKIEAERKARFLGKISGKQRGHILGVGRVLASRGRDVLISPKPRCTQTVNFDELKRTNKQLKKQMDMIMKGDDEDAGKEEDEDSEAAKLLGYSAEAVLDCVFRYTSLTNHRLAICTFNIEMLTEEASKLILEKDEGWEEGEERMLGLHLLEFTEALKESCLSLLPHILCVYLYDLAKKFNSYHSFVCEVYFIGGE
uniref:Arginyl-tRNA synthetase, class Ic n=1 Tax=Tanacetum cinerariifolium TaxID=118510 RepID=A0A6L2P1S9_TANCI|nr:arginyl-tRNA synthetase, class Ic [Tanacetum cinerariifolium]